MSQAIKNILCSRTMGSYGPNKLGDLLQALDARFKEHTYSDIVHDEFIAVNPKVSIKDLLVAATLRGHYVVNYPTKSRIWLSKNVAELISDMAATYQ